MAAQTTRARYAYAAGNPLSNVDPTGMYCWSLSTSCILENVHDTSGLVASVAGACALVLAVTVAGGAACGAVALVAGGVDVASSAFMWQRDQLELQDVALDAGSC